MHYYRARQYDQTHGRFLSRDPVAQANWTSLYGYALNRPALLTDPTGECPICIAIIGIGIIIGVGGCGGGQVDCSTNPCGDPCKCVRERRPAQNCWKETGGVVCCEGKLYPCVFAKTGIKPLDDCVLKHEQTHIDDPDDAVPCIPGTKNYISCQGRKTPGGRARTECRAYLAEMQCLKDNTNCCQTLTGSDNTQCLTALGSLRAKIQEECTKAGLSYTFPCP